MPPTETKGRRHTSIISVAILPVLETTQTQLREKDLEIKTQRGHGKGGQHQNKTDSAVRMKHLPTGLKVFINGRDQQANKREALKLLTAKVDRLLKSQETTEFDSQRQAQLDGGGRSNKVRTYNFINNQVTDHRLNKQANNIKQIMKGRFDILFKK